MNGFEKWFDEDGWKTGKAAKELLPIWNSILGLWMNAGEVRDLLRNACDKAGDQKTFSEKTGISQQYISDVLRGKREPGQAILDVLGLERIVSYQVREVE